MAIDVPEGFSGDIKRKADKSLTKTKNVSSVYVPDVQKQFGFGDVRGTLDALLFVFNSDYSKIEVLIARGQKNNKNQLYCLLADGELNNEIVQLKKRLVTDSVTI